MKSQNEHGRERRQAEDKRATFRVVALIALCFFPWFHHLEVATPYSYDSIASSSNLEPTFPFVVYVIDLNRATEWELTTLPRIGPTLAARILEYRKEFGPFHDVKELLNVRGIGVKTLDLIQPHLCIGSETNSSDETME